MTFRRSLPLLDPRCGYCTGGAFCGHAATIRRAHRHLPPLAEPTPSWTASTPPCPPPPPLPPPETHAHMDERPCLTPATLPPGGVASSVLLVHGRTCAGLTPFPPTFAPLLQPPHTRTAVAHLPPRHCHRRYAALTRFACRACGLLVALYTYAWFLVRLHCG